MEHGAAALPAAPRGAPLTQLNPESAALLEERLALDEAEIEARAQQSEVLAAQLSTTRTEVRRELAGERGTHSCLDRPCGEPDPVDHILASFAHVVGFLNLFRFAVGRVAQGGG